MAMVQTEVTSAMRTTLVDWLGEVRDEFRLHSETLFLAVAYLDGFLATKPVSRGCFQLLGLACVWVAAKFQEVHPPSLNCMLAMAEHMYSADDLRTMEKEVLFTLDFGLAIPTSLRFLHYLLQLSPLPAHPLAATSVRRLSEALLELTLLDPTFLRLLPSQVASVAVYLALGLLQHSEGLGPVVELSEADPHTFGCLVQRLSDTLREAAAQPQPCALLLRFRAWEALHGRQGAVLPGEVPAAATAAATAGGAAEPVTPVNTNLGLAAATSAPRPLRVSASSAVFTAGASYAMKPQPQPRGSWGQRVARRAAQTGNPPAVGAGVLAAEAAGLDAAVRPTTPRAGRARTALDMLADTISGGPALLARCQLQQRRDEHRELYSQQQQQQHMLQPSMQPIWLLQLQPDDDQGLGLGLDLDLGLGPVVPLQMPPSVAGAAFAGPGGGGGGGAPDASCRCPLGDLDALGSLTLTTANAAAAATAAIACG